ncbi:class I SAM-dependent methyltransferase [Acrocarpospora phusangensis]|nr:class I SAM-dependent methyltransferase [Acrocarpospora phusangensis]
MRYSPTPVRTIRRVLQACDVRFEDVSFVDFGCGKGRVLLVAAEFPFRKVIGVEYAQELAETARSNIRRARPDGRRCHDLEVSVQDAAEFLVPPDAGVCYFYEPFSATVAEKVVRNIEESVVRHPRKVVGCLVGRGLPAQDGWDGGASRVGAVLRGRRGWSLARSIASPDDPYYDAWLFTTGGERRGAA